MHIRVQCAPVLIKVPESCNEMHVGTSIISLRGFWGVIVKGFINAASNPA